MSHDRLRGVRLGNERGQPLTPVGIDAAEFIPTDGV